MEFKGAHTFRGSTARLGGVHITAAADMGAGIPLYFQYVKSMTVAFGLMFLFACPALLFAYFGSLVAFKGEDIDYKTIPGLIDATKIYFSWLSFIFNNMKTITAGAVQMDWESNETIKS